MDYLFGRMVEYAMRGDCGIDCLDGNRDPKSCAQDSVFADAEDTVFEKGEMLKEKKSDTKDRDGEE